MIAAVPSAIALQITSPVSSATSTQLVDKQATFTPDPNLDCPPVISNEDLEIPVVNSGPFMDV